MNTKQIVIIEIWYTNRHSMKCSKFCSETISKEFTCSNHVHTRGFGNARTFFASKQENFDQFLLENSST